VTDLRQNDDSEQQNARAAALAFMKRASRDTFAVCAESAENLALKIESDELPVDGATACRMLASMFRASGRARD
jgi:hypothetical protein